MESVIYLDSAATSFPKPAEVCDFMFSFYRHFGVNPGRTGADLALRAEELIHSTRTRLSIFLNPSLAAAGVKKDPNRLVFAANATAALNLILQGTIRPGDHVVTTWTEHNSVIRPVNQLVARSAEATFVPLDGEGDVDPEATRAALRPNTKLVIVNHASNVTGAVQDAAIGAVCRAAGVPFALDVA